MPPALLTAFSSILAGQIIKIFLPLFHGEKLKLADFLKAGGMPSAHTSGTFSLALYIGLKEGFTSSVFALAAMFAFITAHDAVKVRGTINTIINILKQHVPTEILEKEKPLPESVGHDLKEVIAGIILAIPVALIAYRITL